MAFSSDKRKWVRIFKIIIILPICLTQPNIVRFSKFKSLWKADEYLCINIVGAHLHAIPLRLHCKAPEDNCLDFTGI